MTTQPNILFILSDDQGAWAMGCAGNDEIETPNLDRLAAAVREQSEQTLPPGLDVE